MMINSTRLHPDKLRKYIRRHPNATQKQIAAHFDCTPNAVSYALKQHGISYNRKNKNSKIQPEKLRKYVRKHPNATQKQIAARFSCDQTSVSAAIRRYNIPYARNSVLSEDLQKYIDSHPNATQEQIAVHFGRGQSAISDALKHYGILYTRKHPNPSKISEEVLRNYIAKHPRAVQRQIAEHFGCSQLLISSAIRRYNIPYERKSQGGGRRDGCRVPSEALREYVREHPDASQSKIAAYFGFNQATICDALKRYGIPYTNKNRGRRKKNAPKDTQSHSANKK